jgi:tRNA pseudouridine38-40 synthase
MARYFVALSYRGTDFFGWQRQPKEISVQQTIEEAFSKLYSNEPIKVVGCGRTDTGVHAHFYVMHVDLELNSTIDKMIYKLNRILPESIAIKSIEEVYEDKHARFHATSRTYRYFIHRGKNPFKKELSWHVLAPLDIIEMNKATLHLLETQDFTSFSKSNTDTKTNMCTISKAEWIQLEDDSIYFEVTADRFLRNMVRAIVGTMAEVGLGKLSPEDIPSIIQAKDRGAASTSVPAHGLYLWDVVY